MADDPKLDGEQGLEAVTLEERVIDEPEWAARQIVWLRAERDRLAEQLADLQRWDEDVHDRKRQLRRAEAKALRRVAAEISSRVRREIHPERVLASWALRDWCMVEADRLTEGAGCSQKETL